jgi:hypothetical protein
MVKCMLSLRAQAGTGDGEGLRRLFKQVSGAVLGPGGSA